MQRPAARVRRPICLALTLLFVATVAAPLAMGVDEGTGSATPWRVTLEITSSLAGPRKMFEAFDTASLNLYDLNGDGQLEIISVNDNNVVYVIDSKTGRVLTEVETFHYNNSRWPARELNPVAIGELYGDGVPCMVVPNSASWLTAFCYDAAASNATSFAFPEKWRVRVDAALYEPDFKETHPFLYYDNGTAKHLAGMDGHAYLSDVTGDGTLEVFVETDSWPGQFAFSHDGKYLWSKSFSDGNAGAIVRDIDKDGVKEAVFFGDGGLVTTFNAKTGGIEWVFDTRKYNTTPGSIPVAGLVADLHGDGKFEVVFGARHAVQTNDPDWINQSHARYFAVDSKGQMLWNASYDWMNPLQYQHPAAADVNGDGILDVIFLDWNTIGHKPGDWNTTNRKSNLFALDGRDGTALWHKGITVYWSNKDIVIMDVDGDGKQEIVAPTAKAACEGLGVYDLKTGDDRGFFCAGGGWGMSRGPVAGDLYGDGKTYLVVPYDQDGPGTNYRSIDVGWREGKLVIIETGTAFSGVKFSANFQLNDAIDQGVKGTSGTPPKPTPSPLPTPSPTPSATPPTATPTGTPNAPPAAAFTLLAQGLSVSADASASTDPDGAIVRYDWTWGDGAVSEGPTSTHEYAAAGSYLVTMMVRDDAGATATATKTIVVNATATTPSPSGPPGSAPTPDVPEESRLPAPGLAVVMLLVGAVALAVRRRR